MTKPRIVIDTNVWIAALRSKYGASRRLLERIGSEHFELTMSVPLLLEYEEVAKRSNRIVGFDEKALDEILDYIAGSSHQQIVFYLWRPFLRDPEDDMILELAVAAHCAYIVSYNKDDFMGAERFGLEVVTPRELIMRLGLID